MWTTIKFNFNLLKFEPEASPPPCPLALASLDWTEREEERGGGITSVSENTNLSLFSSFFRLLPLTDIVMEGISGTN